MLGVPRRMERTNEQKRKGAITDGEAHPFPRLDQTATPSESPSPESSLSSTRSSETTSGSSTRTPSVRPKLAPFPSFRFELKLILLLPRPYRHAPRPPIQEDPSYPKEVVQGPFTSLQEGRKEKRELNTNDELTFDLFLCPIPTERVRQDHREAAQEEHPLPPPEFVPSPLSALVQLELPFRSKLTLIPPSFPPLRAEFAVKA